MTLRPVGLQKVTRHSVADTAHESVRSAIISGVFAPGEQLVETRIADELGVSRGTAREALRRLRDEGLATGSANRGVFVRELTLEEFLDLHNVRIGIETVAVRLCTRLQRPTKSLHRLIGEMEARAQRGDALGLSDREISFHEELCELSGNAQLSAAFRSISAIMRLAFVAEYAAYGDPTRVPQEHVPLVEAIESGDEGRAVAALVAHTDIALTLRNLELRFSWPESAGVRERLVAVAGIASWTGAPAQPAGEKLANVPTAAKPSRA